MDHADVLDRLMTAFSEPGGLASLEADHSLEGEELLRHLETCDECRAELEAWQLTSVALAAATPDSLRAPAEARGRILAAVAANGVARGRGAAALGVPSAPGLTVLPGGSEQAGYAEQANMARSADPALPEGAARPNGAARAEDLVLPADVARPGEPSRLRRLRPGSAAGDRLPFRWLALAAAIAVLVFVGGALLGPQLGFTPEPGGESDLAQVVTAMDSIIQQPGHVTAPLRTASGQPGGSVLVDPATGNLTVVSTALTPVSSQTYDCYFVRGAAKTRIGQMHFSDQTSYWLGKVQELSNPGQPGDTFEVRLGGTTGVLSLSGNF
jgi:anti-sigma factor RsiW